MTVIQSWIRRPGQCESEKPLQPNLALNEPGTGGLPQWSDSDEEEEEDDDDEEQTQESVPLEAGVADEESASEFEDECEERGDGGFPGNVSNKCKKTIQVPKFFDVDGLHKFSQKRQLGTCCTVRQCRQS